MSKAKTKGKVQRGKLQAAGAERKITPVIFFSCVFGL